MSVRTSACEPLGLALFRGRLTARFSSNSIYGLVLASREHVDQRRWPILVSNIKPGIEAMTSASNGARPHRACLQAEPAIQRLGSGCYERGNVTLNVVPSPGLDTTVTSPPCERAISRTM